jgi:hypothetical protein
MWSEKVLNTPSNTKLVMTLKWGHNFKICCRNQPCMDV